MTTKKRDMLVKIDMPDATISGNLGYLIRALRQKRAPTGGVRFNYFKKTHAKCFNK